MISARARATRFGRVTSVLPSATSRRTFRKSSRCQRGMLSISAISSMATELYTSELRTHTPHRLSKEEARTTNYNALGARIYRTSHLYNNVSQTELAHPLPSPHSDYGGFDVLGVLYNCRSMKPPSAHSVRVRLYSWGELLRPYFRGISRECRPGASRRIHRLRQEGC